MSSAVVLSSGGINSAVVLEIALRAHRPAPIHMLSFKYESKSNDQESLASLDLYHYYRDHNENVTWDQIELTDLSVVGSLLNTTVLSIATSHAITESARYLYTGMYNDNKYHGFLGSMATVIYLNSHAKVRLTYPLLWLTKSRTIKRAYDLEVPINLTWSCLQPFDQNVLGLPYIHCGECSKCILRILGLKELGITDPVDYAIKLEWNTTVLWPFIGEKQLRAREL